MKSVKLMVFIGFLVVFSLFGISRFTVSRGVGAVEYFHLSSPQLIIKKGPEGAFDSSRTHTLTILELNKNGYRFWGYYTGWDGKNIRNDMGLAYSNDLIHWTKEGTAPVIPNLRWGSAVVVDGVINLFGTRNYGDNSYIVRLSSEDGKTFTEHETVAGPVDGHKNQNPFIFYDERVGIYRLYYFHATPEEMYIEEKHSRDITQLANIHARKVLSSESQILAAPSVMYRDGKYWLTAETLVNAKTMPKWETIAYVSGNPVRGFVPTANSRILVNDDACLFQYVFDNKLNAVYSHRNSDDSWEMYNRVTQMVNNTNITVSEEKVNLVKDGTRQITVQNIKSDGNSDDVTQKATWSTSDNKVVTVKKGKLEAKGAGSAIVTVSYGGASRTVQVVVDAASAK